MGALQATDVVTIAGAQLSVYAAGGGPTLVFLHGNAGRWQHWEYQLRALSRRFRCIAFDFRGYGASSPLDGPNSISQMANDTLAICEHLEVAGATIVGLSMGGGVAQALALLHPQLVDGLVLVSSQAIDVIPPVVPELTTELLRTALLASFSPVFRVRRPDLVARLVAEQLETRIETLNNITFDDLPMDTSVIRAPALVLAGELDTLAPVWVTQQLAARLPNASYCEIAGAAHNINVEAPDALVAAIRQFALSTSVRATRSHAVSRSPEGTEAGEVS